MSFVMYVRYCDSGK